MADNVNPPTQDEVVHKLRQLVADVITRQEASDWASQWITKFDQFKQGNFAIDRKIKHALDALAGADTPSSDREYLFDKVDFEAWLQEFTA